MPEKPEVVTVMNSLKTKILGKKITDVNIYWNNIIAYPEANDFIKKIINQTINDIKSRGKFIRIILDDYNLLIHLRMEGKFLFRKVNEKIEKHEHVEFILDNIISFRYKDVRKFGKMYLIENDLVEKIKPLSKLGLEYNSDKLDVNYLKMKFKNKNIPIKTILLDQSIITGIGNIYADEILFLSRINPYKKGCLLNDNELNLIIKNTNEVLDKAIKLGGTTIRSFTSEEGVHGLFQNELLVHNQKICCYCNNKIIKEKINQRGTYFCKNCQK